MRKVKLVTTMTLCALTALMLSGCAGANQPSVIYGGKDPLTQLENLNASHFAKAKNDNKIRYQALKESAIGLAAREALSYRGNQLNTILEAQSQSLMQIFDFNQILLPHNVVPPVLVQSTNSLRLAGPDSIRLADQTYLIIQQAHFVTAPPTWRDYLIGVYRKPDLPDGSLLPHNSEEQTYWKKAVEKGWRLGTQQAELNFSSNLARLIRDYQGMVLYRKLSNENIVSAPFVANTDLGITGGGDNLRINDRVLRITALPSLSAKGGAWQPALIDQHKNS